VRSSVAPPRTRPTCAIGLAADVTSMDPHFLNLQPNVNIGWHVFDALTPWTRMRA